MPTYVSKILSAASSNRIGTISTAATPVVTLSSSALDTQRRIAVYPSTGGGDISASYTIIGTQQGGLPQRETITGSSAGAGGNATTQDFLTVTSIVTSCSPINLGATFGTNTTGGTPWAVVDTGRNPVNVGFGLTFSSTSMLASVEYTFDDPTQTISSLPYNTGPKVFVSTAASSVAVATNGNINFPIAAWRVTLTSTQTTGTAYASVIQSGV